MFPQVPAILLCQEYDELKVPSSPPRRLSRSSIDLRDLEAQHEREKIMSQNVSESVSSIYHCFDSHIRYSESEPINAHIKALENQFSMKSSNNGEHQPLDKNQQHHHQQSESKTSMNNFSFMNNFDNSLVLGTTPATTASTAKENDMNLISSASIIKDNHQVNANNNNNSNSSGNNNNGSSTGSSSNNGKKSFKKRMLASSDSDFFSLLRYNSVKLRRMNCFSIGSTNGNGSNQGASVGGGSGGGGGGGGAVESSSSSNEGNKPKNMIYALSDSDFLIRVSDNNKTFHLNNERKFQAIVNKSDIFNYLNKSFDHNLLDYNSAEHNQKRLTDVESKCKKQFGDADFFNVDKLKKVFEESQQKIDSDDNNLIIASNTNSNNSASIISSEKLLKKETVSLPPLVNSTSNDINLKLNNSRSIDTVLLNIKNNNDKLYTFKLLHDFSPKAINQDESLNKNLLKDSIQRQSTAMTTSSGSDVDIQQPLSTNVASSASTANNNNNNNNNHSSLSMVSAAVDSNAPAIAVMGSHLLKPVNLNDSSLNGQQNVLDYDSGGGSIIKCSDRDAEDREVGKRKRTASTVTYNVNVIDFQSEDEPNVHHLSSGGGGGGGTGKRSNSSTSK